MYMCTNLCFRLIIYPKPLQQHDLSFGRNLSPNCPPQIALTKNYARMLRWKGTNQK